MTLAVSVRSLSKVVTSRSRIPSSALSVKPANWRVALQLPASALLPELRPAAASPCLPTAGSIHSFATVKFALKVRSPGQRSNYHRWYFVPQRAFLRGSLPSYCPALFSLTTYAFDLSAAGH